MLVAIILDKDMVDLYWMLNLVAFTTVWFVK